jgi:hypothetical protein
MTAKDIQELVATRHPSCIKHLAEHQPELHASNTRINLADLTNCIKNTDSTGQ